MQTATQVMVHHAGCARPSVDSLATAHQRAITALAAVKIAEPHPFQHYENDPAPYNDMLQGILSAIAPLMNRIVEHASDELYRGEGIADTIEDLQIGVYASRDNEAA
jgi:hypothetical protein